MKIDYVTLRLTGSPGSVASFVPMGLDVEMTPERGELGLCSRLVDWEGQGLVFTDEIPRYTRRHAMQWLLSQDLIPQQSERKTSCNPSWKKHAKLHYCACQKAFLIKRRDVQKQLEKRQSRVLISVTAASPVGFYSKVNFKYRANKHITKSLFCSSTLNTHLRRRSGSTLWQSCALKYPRDRPLSGWGTALVMGS